MTRSRFATLSASVLTLILLVALIVLAKPMYPLTRGASEDFWAIAAGVQLRGTKEGFSDSACFDGDQAYFTPTSMDATWTYWLPKDEAMRDFPLVQQELDARAANPADLTASVVAYRHWKSQPASDQDADHLLLCFEDEKARRLANNPEARAGFSEYLAMTRYPMVDQIQKSHYYWANCAFEFFYFGGLIWFVLWPIIHGKSALRWWLHIALVPFLLFLPAWLGYCAARVTGTGPAGGIVYPQLTCMTAIEPWKSEVWFYSVMPDLLDSINQCPEWSTREALQTLKILNISLVPGPIHAAIVSGVLILFLMGIHFLKNYWHQLSILRQPGVEVLPVSIPSNKAAESAPRDSARVTEGSSKTAG